MTLTPHTHHHAAAVGVGASQQERVVRVVVERGVLVVLILYLNQEETRGRQFGEPLVLNLRNSTKLSLSEAKKLLFYNRIVCLFVLMSTNHVFWFTAWMRRFFICCAKLEFSPCHLDDPQHLSLSICAPSLRVIPKMQPKGTRHPALTLTVTGYTIFEPALRNPNAGFSRSKSKSANTSAPPPANGRTSNSCSSLPLTTYE